MIEQEWLECTDPKPMLEYLRGNASARKSRLFACACCRRAWRLLTEQQSRDAIDVAERYADEIASEEEVARARAAVKRGAHSLAIAFGYGDAWRAAKAVEIALRPLIMAWRIDRKGHRAQGSTLLDVFGNPFRPISIYPGWLNPTVTGLARAAYEERIPPSGELDIERLAVLSDALEEAGCDDEDILDHLRSPGPHVRGCWVLDLVLGKE